MTDDAIEAPDTDEDAAKAVDLDPVTAVKRKRFHETTANDLAKAVGMNARRCNKVTEKFAYFEDDKRFVIVAGAQEKHEVAHALARGLGLRGDRRLVLVLPEGRSFATMQRAPWFKREAQPEIWTYAKGAPEKRTLRSRRETERKLLKHLGGQKPEDELMASTRAKHFGARSKAVWELVEWPTSHGRLDPSHVRGERAWHCLGQKVLSIKGTRGGLAVRAGVHYSGAKAPTPIVATTAAPLIGIELGKVRAAVEAGVSLRIDSKDRQIHKADEHWLQAVIRRDPALVGVEQPALREFPAWRPRDDAKEWGRGFIDLMGIDGHGNIRIVETKVARNADEMLILQGLDYYIWSQVYDKEVRHRLAAAPGSTFEIHYVIGDSDNKLYVAPHVRAQVHALVDDVRWRFQTVAGWYGHPDRTRRATPKLLAEGKLPPVKGTPT